MIISDFFVRFWGVRGSLPCPGDSYSEFGGNTPCVEMRCGDSVLVFDAGSGIRELGKALVGERCSRLDLFFTHCHYDHICGLPFFSPLFRCNTTMGIWSGHHEDAMTTKDMVASFMRPPFFPVGPEVFKADVDYRDFSPGDVLEPDNGVRVTTTSLNHPNGCIGYRVEFGGRTICYVSDTEHEEGKTDENVLALIRDADIVIYDAAYTTEEFGCFQGWGHSTWEEGARLCDLANADQFVVFHHCPSHDDGFMGQLADDVARFRTGSLVAREGMTLSA
jgi:phosphoribosyl 1,2-cyclic phosphodiesterase